MTNNTEALRKEFEESMGVYMLVFDWNESQKKYKSIDGSYSEDRFNEYFEIFTDAYQAAHASQKKVIDSLRAENEQLKALSDAAIRYIDESPCDPDIYPEQLAAWEKYRALKDEHETGNVRGK